MAFETRREQKALTPSQALALICNRFPQMKVLILSIYDSSDHCLRAVRAGAQGYVLKESAAVEIVTAIRTIMAGQRYFDAAACSGSVCNRSCSKTPKNQATPHPARLK